uniref:hypothetical protein n=1 Tax=Alcaligenes faecalis TaxID=511 RepID=UPI00155DA4DA|nr:hypothetical protein [Alcaligenes faecalis]
MCHQLQNKVLTDIDKTPVLHHNCIMVASLNDGGNMQVRVIVGAQAAYACISHESGTLDVRLNPGRSARKSMKESAAELREKAAELTRRAALIENAAELVD